MAETADSKARDAEPAAVPSGFNRWRAAAIAVGVAVLLTLAFFVWRAVREDVREDRWEALWQIRRDAGIELEGELTGRDWLSPKDSAADIEQRDSYRRRLEAFLEEHGEDDATAADVHAELFNLEQIQILALGPGAPVAALRERYDRAEAHLKAIIDRHPDFPMNWDAFKPQGASSVAYLLLTKLRENRDWQEKHALKPATPDPDTVVLLRTTKGDLRLRLYTAESPSLAKAFRERVASGDLDGTALFQSRDDPAEKWVRGGDPKTRKADATDEERAKWGEPTPDDPLPYESARYVVLHRKGTVSAWHDPGETDDDPVQFLVVTADSGNMNGAYTPFAQIDESSFATLERIAAVRTLGRENPEITRDEKRSRLHDHLVKPVTIVRALLYEKGELSARHDASKVRPTEKRLADVVPDEDREKEAPPPPTTPPAMTEEPPMGEAPMDDGAGK